MNNKIIQKIADHLTKSAPQGWQAINIKCEIDEDLTQFDATYTVNNKEKIFLSLDFGIEDLFAQLRGEVITVNEPFKQAYFQLTNNGKFEMKYGYEALPWE